MSNLRRSEREALARRVEFDNEVKRNHKISEQVQDFWKEKEQQDQEKAENLRKYRGW